MAAKKVKPYKTHAELVRTVAALTNVTVAGLTCLHVFGVL